MPRRSSGKARKRAARTGSPWAAGASAAGRGWRRGILRALTAVVALGLLGSGAAGTTAASAGTTTAVGAGCTRMVTGVHHGALVAGSGVLCLDRATQTGPVHVWPRAGLKVTGSVISGAVTTTRARSVRICGSTIIGPLRASVTAGPVTAGAGGASCRGDIGHGRVVISGSARRVQVTGLRQTGPVTLSGNAAGVTLSGASVAGTVTVRGNRGHGQLVIAANAVSGSLVCAANQPAPGDRHRPNTVSGTASGQCRTLVPAPPRRRALPPLPEDESSTLPNLNYGQAVGDFTGTGHDQLAYAQDSQLKIADVSKFGGAVHSAIPTDLMATPNDGLDTNTPLGPSHVSVWENDCIISSYCGQLRNNGATYGLTSVKVAASASDIYMAGATWDGSDPADSYQLHLYKLSHDGSCAIASCAEKKVSLPSIFNGPSGPSRLIVVTSLATGVVGGRTLIAVGLSDEGIDIFDDSLNLVATIGDIAVDGNGTQTPPTALAFGPPSGPGQGGLLAGGVESPGSTMFTWRLNPDGTEQSVTRDGGWFPDVEMAATFAQINGQTVTAFTRSDGDVIVFALGNNGNALGDLPVGQRTGQPTGLTVVTPPGGDPGTQELVVGKLGGTGDQVLQWVNGALTAAPIGPGGATEATTNQVYAWWPGYAAGRLRVADNSAGPVDIAMASRPDVGFGCWLNAAVTGPPAIPAFPVSDTRVAAGAVTPDYFAAALTAGSDGSCAAAQSGSKGERAAYVIITPAGDSADEHIVKLTAGADGTPRIDSQVGGYLTASLTQVSPTPGSSGTWQLALTGGSAPVALTAPAVTGHRLTAEPDPASYEPPTSPAADDPCRPVYRFDVTGARWKNVTSAGQVSAQLPPMTAQGSTDGGTTWQDLGQLMPSAAPAVAADGTVTLGPASFFFQNLAGTATPAGVWTSGQPSQCPATGQAPVTEVRVVSGGLASSPVMLADPTAPPLNGGERGYPDPGGSGGPGRQRRRRGRAARRRGGPGRADAPADPLRRRIGAGQRPAVQPGLLPRRRHQGPGHRPIPDRRLRRLHRDRAVCRRRQRGPAHPQLPGHDQHRPRASGPRDERHRHGHWVHRILVRRGRQQQPADPHRGQHHRRDRHHRLHHQPHRGLHAGRARQHCPGAVSGERHRQRADDRAAADGHRDHRPGVAAAADRHSQRARARLGTPGRHCQPGPADRHLAVLPQRPRRHRTGHRRAARPGAIRPRRRRRLRPLRGHPARQPIAGRQTDENHQHAGIAGTPGHCQRPAPLAERAAVGGAGRGHDPGRGGCPGAGGGRQGGTSGLVSNAFAMGGGVGGSIDQRTGAFQASVPLVSVTGPAGTGLSLTLGYNQSLASLGASGNRFGLGAGWTLGVPWVDTTGGVHVYPASGGSYAYDSSQPTGLADYPLRDLTFVKNPGSTQPPPGVPVRQYLYTLTYLDGTTDRFDANGNLIEQVDRFGNAIDLTWQQSGSWWQPTSVIDSYGQMTKFLYAGGKVTVTAPVNAEGIAATNTLDITAGRLMGVTDALGQTTSFGYSPVTGLPAPLLSSVTSPTGEHTTVTYTPLAYEPGVVAVNTVAVTDAHGSRVLPELHFDINPALRQPAQLHRLPRLQQQRPQRAVQLRGLRLPVHHRAD